MNRSMGKLRTKTRTFADASLEMLMRVFTAWLTFAEGFGEPARNRLFSPSRTCWLFLAQVLSADGSCREAVGKFLGWLAYTQGKTASPNSAAYCKARERLPLNALMDVHAAVVTRVQRSPLAQRLWCGRRVAVVDGTGISMPDTEQNQRLYPQSKASKPGCGFPEMRLVALFSLATGVLIHYTKASLKVDERTLFRRLWDHLEAGTVILADRGFCSFADYYLLLQRGIDSVMRLHQRRQVGLHIIKRLGPGDTLVHWHKSKVPSKAFCTQQWRALPDILPIRHISFSVSVRGFRTRSITVATTLLDHKRYPPKAFAQLYRQRWMAELYFRDIKIALGMDSLRCKTPAMVHKELAMHIIAYNLIRATMLEAAQSADKLPEQLSFKGTVQTVRQWDVLITLAPHHKRQDLYKTMLATIAADTLPYRPNRNEPRARKRRPKNYQLLNKPRHLFKECPHRNHYRKSLS
jgi:hypothetical protein